MSLIKDQQIIIWEQIHFFKKIVFMYYKIPLRFDRLLNGLGLTECSLGESIAQYIQLIIGTRYGEHQADSNFGCEIWNFDFELMVKKEDYELRLKHSLEHTISVYETRLANVEVVITIGEKEIVNLVGSAEMKNQAIIVVYATVKETDEPFYFKTIFYLNPIIAA